MRCDTTPMCRAHANVVCSRRRVWRRGAAGLLELAARAIRAAGRDARTSVMTSRNRLSSQLQMNPVRQCARRWMLAIDVTQASPLFSDHAPREVHLWQ